MNFSVRTDLASLYLRTSRDWPVQNPNDAPGEPLHTTAVSARIRLGVPSPIDRRRRRRLQLSIRDILVITAIVSVTLAVFLDGFLGGFSSLYASFTFSATYLVHRPAWRDQLSRFDRRLLIALSVIVLLQAGVGYWLGYSRTTSLDPLLVIAIEGATLAAFILTGVAAIAFASNLGNFWMCEPFWLPAFTRALAASAIVSVTVMFCAASRGEMHQIHWLGHDRIAQTCRKLGEAIHQAPWSASLRAEAEAHPDFGAPVKVTWEPDRVRFKRQSGEFIYLRREKARSYSVIWQDDFGHSVRLGGGPLEAPR